MPTGRLIVTMAVLNEERYIEQTITNFLDKVKDVDIIEIFDGAWVNGGTTLNSTDKTKEIIEKLQKKFSFRVDIQFHEAVEFYRNEAHKRNHMLEYCEELYGYEPYWIFVLDGDEEIRFKTGIEHIWMKDFLGNLPFMGLIEAYAIGSDRPMLGVRCIPGGKGFHYHSNRSMIVHSADCKEVVVDYNLKNQVVLRANLLNTNVFVEQHYYIVNLWPTREKSRMEMKAEYCKFQEEVEQVENKPCDYKQPIKNSVPTE